jgi:hypothetical protein
MNILSGVSFPFIYGQGISFSFIFIQQKTLRYRTSPPQGLYTYWIVWKDEDRYPWRLLNLSQRSKV